MNYDEAVTWLASRFAGVTDPQSAMQVCRMLGEAKVDVKGYHHLLFQLDSTHMHFGRQIFPKDDDNPIELGAEWEIVAQNADLIRNVIIYGALPGQVPEISQALKWPEFWLRVSAVGSELRRRRVTLRNMRVLW